MNTVEPIRNTDDVHAMKHYLRERGEKYYIMFITGIYLGLRINEILSLRIRDVKGRNETVFRQRKTGKEVAVAFNPELLKAYREYCDGKDPDEALISNPYNPYKPITRARAYKVLRETAEKLKIQNVGTHTMRKTCGYHYYKQTHDIATLQVWFNHRHQTDTLRYIGITRENIKKAMVAFRI